MTYDVVVREVAGYDTNLGREKNQDQTLDWIPDQIELRIGSDWYVLFSV